MHTMTVQKLETDRPDPDSLLRRMQAEEDRAKRGRLKIFFGACAGVGKTCAMLSAARDALAQSRPLIVGLVETHGRSVTQEMAQHLPHLPLKEVPYRDKVLQEFDLDGALAFGQAHAGGLVLLDELAHSNVPGSRHPKRWQDVQELLDAGLDVWTTMNVQHLESLNDIVSGITGVRVWETVPDRIFDEANEVVVVDLPPDELLQRLKAGKVYLPQQAQRAATHFFRKGNLLALRELALRRTADRVDGEMQTYRKDSGMQPIWANREALLAYVESDDQGEKVVRSCARLANQLNVPWHAVYVETPAVLTPCAVSPKLPLRALKLAKELGAITATRSTPRVSTALLTYAREHNLARLVIGRQTRSWTWSKSLADQMAEQASDLDVLQIALPQSKSTTPPPPLTDAQAQAWSWQGYVVAVGACVLTALLSTPLLDVFELTNIVMLFLLAVVGIALRYGRGPSVLASFVGVGLFDFFFVPPRFSFAVSDVQYLVTFVVMLAVGLLIGQLTAGLKVQAQAATQREHRVRSLYEMSRDLSSVLLPQQVAEIGARFLAIEFSAKSALLLADEADRLQILPGATATVDMGVAQWSFSRGELAGRGTDTLNASTSLVIPLKAPMRIRGVLAVEPRQTSLLGPEQLQLLDMCASLLAISLERIHYIEVAQASTVQMESERLRNSLLSAISHDLRTPLASLVGLVDTMEMTQPALTAQQQDMALAIKASALRMSALVTNLLDMARLEAGAVKINREWQPLEESVGSALLACTPLLAGRPLRVALAAGLPLLYLDSVLMERVVVNLLENAAKYTPKGTAIDIEAHLENDHLVLSIEDHGAGLPKGREAAIFEKFERGEKEAATPGVGLGLTICRAIIEAHEGIIRAENRLQGGARFIITLPLGHPPADDGSTAEVSLDERSS
jgi:two-component system sensor histidine kinase KdpD